MEKVLLQDSKYFNKDIYKDTHPEKVLTYTILTFDKTLFLLITLYKHNYLLCNLSTT